MSILDLLKTKNLDPLIKNLEKEKSLVISGMSNLSSKAFFVSYFSSKLKESNFFWITNSVEEAIEIGKDLFVFLGGEKIHTLFGEVSESEKIRLLAKIQKGGGIFLLPKDKISEDFSLYENLLENSFKIEKDKDLDLISLFETLSKNGYEVSLDARLEKGTYRRTGTILDIFPPNLDSPLKLELDGDKVSSIFTFDQDEKKAVSSFEDFLILPNKLPEKKSRFYEAIKNEDVLVFDELDLFTPGEIATFAKLHSKKILDFNLFPEDDSNHHHLRYLSLLKFYNTQDLISDLRDKISDKWEVLICTKRAAELTAIFDEYKFSYSLAGDGKGKGLKILELPQDAFLPHSFQNPEEKILFLSEKEIFTIQKAKRNQSVKKLALDFITSLKPGDYVVHFDHGIGHFEGILKKKVDEVNREYLEISYAGNDKIFVPIDQVDKLSKYLTPEDGEEPKLSKLGGASWKTVQSKVKEETKKIAKELLDLYAKRSQIKRAKFFKDSEKQEQFEKSFPYEETPGQIKAINDVKEDLEKDSPMDRLVVGDVGFGKTEVAMRAAFKASESGKQVAVIAPVTILAVQHFESFQKRMQPFGKKVASLTRFQTSAEQKEILEKVKKGDVDILIGTHRLLSDDIKFFNLGLLIIDEEQKFGVKQKEKLKEAKLNVDVLTMTATPIPRTLNMGLNKLRDITTITTPPQGRLPVISEVRKYNDGLVRQAILKELERKGQIYFLHNRVETIEGIAEKLRILVPEAKFVVAHGQLNPHTLEERILAYKRGDFDVLISSTIIENGIDLSNANTMIVNNAERFGLSQLYQLRGRIGRSKRQAYAYFLYHVQGVSIDAKKRLRAIVEASELGAGFQIAMKDLEIRGAGDILGAKQSGSVNTIGVSHFLRVLEKTVEELRTGGNLKEIGNEAIESTTIDLPIDALIPDTYIPDPNEKMAMYQKLSAVTNEEMLDEFFEDMKEEYGETPREVKNLDKLLRLKLDATKALIRKIFTRSVPGGKELVFTLSDNCKPENIFKALDVNPAWQIRGDSIAIKMENLSSLWLTEIHKTTKAMIAQKKVKKKK